MNRGLQLSEGYLLALLPLVGIAIVAVHQMGQYQFYGVPLELLELDTVKIILSGMTLSLYGAAGIYAVTLVYDKVAPPGALRIFNHLAIAAFITMPFWIGGMDFKAPLSWPTIIFVVFCASVTTFAERQLRRIKRADSQLPSTQQIGPVAALVFWVGLLILVATWVHGGIWARDRPERTFIEGTDQIVVGRAGDALIVKEYDPAKRSIDTNRTALVKGDKTIVLVTRGAPVQ